MIDIAYIVSHGFAARMVTQTNLLGLLVQAGRKVALISPDKNDSNLKEYCTKHNVQLYEFNPSSKFWTSQYTDIRKYFLEDIDNNVALKEKHIWATRYNTSKNPINHIRPRLAYIAYKLTKKFPSIRSWYKAREEKHLESIEADSLIEKLKPKLLIATYPVNFAEAMLLKSGNKNPQIKTLIHLLSWDNISCKGHFPQLADEYIAWGPIMKQEFIDYYNIEPNKIHECGVPHFDVHIVNRNTDTFKKEVTRLGLNPDHPYLFFGMSSPRFAPREIDIVEWLAKKITEGEFGENLQLVVRPHPQNVQGYMADKSWIPRLQKICNHRVAIDMPSLINSNLAWSMKENDMNTLSALLSGSKICLNSGSTVCIDALMCHVPVILTSFDGDHQLEYWKSSRRLIDYPHLKKMISYGGISVANNFKSLHNLIHLYLKDPYHLIEARENTVGLQCIKLSGNATNQAIECLNHI